jgi:MOSC domain-containing protein YiiM
MESGRVEALFIYPVEGGPAESRSEIRVTASEGIEGDQPRSPNRAVTLLSLDQWAEVQSELGAELAPEIRRSNVAVRGIALPQTMGRRLRIGEVELEIGGETRPCDVMDASHQGLSAALAGELRGGVYGNVIQPGVIKSGDAVEVVG